MSKVKLVLAAAMFPVLLAGCPGAPERLECRFEIGQEVRFVVQPDIKAQVYDVYNRAGWPGGCRYHVRAAASQATTDGRLIAADGPIETTPVALVKFVREFELREEP